MTVFGHSKKDVTIADHLVTILIKPLLYLWTCLVIVTIIDLNHGKNNNLILFMTFGQDF
jgi:hypothetical protein